MTLEEMLALLPDNTTGAIQAVDLRTIVTELYNLSTGDAAQIAALGNQVAALGLEVDAMQGIDADVTVLQGDVAALQSGLTALTGTVSSHTTLLSAHSGDIGLLQGDVAGLRADVEALELRGTTVAQSFSYLWTTTGSSPAVGKVLIDAWSMSATKIQLNETTDDGQNLTFQLFDNGNNRQIRLLTQDGKRLVAGVVGATVDQGAYREINIVPVSVTGAAPTNGQKVTVAIIMELAAP